MLFEIAISFQFKMYYCILLVIVSLHCGGVTEQSGKLFWSGSVTLQTLLAMSQYCGWVWGRLGVLLLGGFLQCRSLNGLPSGNQLWVDYSSEIL